MRSTHDVRRLATTRRRHRQPAGSDQQTPRDCDGRPYAGPCDRMIVVATDEEAFRKVRRKLNREGLLVDDRVELVLREEVDWDRMW